MKNLIKSVKILNWLVRFSFGFISLKPKKPNRTELKPSQTEKTKLNRAKPKKPS